MITEETFQDWLSNLLKTVSDKLQQEDDEEDGECDNFRDFIEPIDYDEENVYPDRIVTYEEVMMMSSNKGIVVTLSDGSEFQITIVRSK